MVARAKYSITRRDTTRYDTIRYDTMRYDATRRDAMKWFVVPYDESSTSITAFTSIAPWWRAAIHQRDSQSCSPSSSTHLDRDFSSSAGQRCSWYTYVPDLGTSAFSFMRNISKYVIYIKLFSGSIDFSPIFFFFIVYFIGYVTSEEFGLVIHM